MLDQSIAEPFAYKLPETYRDYKAKLLREVNIRGLNQTISKRDPIGTW